jgi:8-oxo-dGTP diphosphatase
VATKTTDAKAPLGYDPSQFPAFAVTVDVVVLTMSEGLLHVLLVCRGEEPFEGMWAIPGGFKRPTETLDEAARRELVEETGVDPASLLSQFGAYGDPGRDPRMNVVTIGYLAVLRDVGAVAGGSDAAAAALIPVSDVLKGKVDLAFDHLHIVRDAIDRVRTELELTGIAAAFVGPTFTLAELRAVYEAVWGVQLDAANFRRRVVTEEGWVIPTGQNSDHAKGNTGGGPAWVASIVNAIGTSTCGYWQDTAIFVTWDDWGGWYDHEPPAILASPEGGYQYGFRVPLIAVSAYTAPQFVDNKRHDFGSILRFIEHNYGIGNLGFADTRCDPSWSNCSLDDLQSFFDLTRASRPFQTVLAQHGAEFFFPTADAPRSK